MDLRLKGYEDVKQSEMNKEYDIMICLFFGFHNRPFLHTEKLSTILGRPSILNYTEFYYITKNQS